jgi:serine/tyrosine/threonine adenylyltransferase
MVEIRWFDFAIEPEMIINISIIYGIYCHYGCNSWSPASRFLLMSTPSLNGCKISLRNAAVECLYCGYLMRGVLKGVSKMCSKVPISRLPIPKPTHLLTHNLTPDPLTPSVAAFRDEVLTKRPITQRRSRLLAPQSHFSYVSPLPLPFPYDLQIIERQIKTEDIEQWLAGREAVHKRPPGDAPESNPSNEEVELEVYYAKNRDARVVLIGLAETGLNDCVPHLDVGDAFETLGAPSFFPTPEEFKSSEGTSESAAAPRARQELVDVLSGHAVLMSSEKSKVHFAPWFVWTNICI